MENLNAIGLDTKKAKELAEKLNVLLANYSIFYQNTRGYHWNIKGEKFFELHLKFEELYNDLFIKIDEIAEEGNDRVSHAAKDLLRIISENKNRLLSDEVEHILEPLGIEIRHDAYYVQYFSKSQRLALSSTADTKTKDAAIRWVLSAPPNHPIKMDTAIELIKSDKIRCRKIAKQIELDGLSVHPIWEEYLEWMS